MFLLKVTAGRKQKNSKTWNGSAIK